MRPADLATLMAQLAAAPDSRSFFVGLCQALPQWLPATRVDLLVSGWADGVGMPLVGDADAPAAPAAADRSADSFAAWLESSGYRSVAMQPLNGAGQHLGWLALARRSAPIAADDLALAAQLAALIALRLAHEQLRDQLGLRDDTLAAAEQRLSDAEDLRLRATLAVGTAHDIGNLLAVVIGHAQMLQREAPAEHQGDLRAIVRAASDGHILLRRLIALKSAAAPAPAGHSQSLPALARDALELTRPFWDTRANIIIRTALYAAPPVRAQAADLREILVNLIINALAAMPSGGVLTLRTYGDTHTSTIEVTDTGQGIALEYQSRIFQPGLGDYEGVRGFGLSMSRAIAEQYGGTLVVRSAPGQGATFTLTLPVLLEAMVGSPVAAVRR